MAAARDSQGGLWACTYKPLLTLRNYNASVLVNILVDSETWDWSRQATWQHDFSNVATLLSRKTTSPLITAIRSCASGPKSTVGRVNNTGRVWLVRSSRWLQEFKVISTITHCECVSLCLLCGTFLVAVVPRQHNWCARNEAIDQGSGYDDKKANKNKERLESGYATN